MTPDSHINTSTKESPNSYVDKSDDINVEFDIDERIDIPYTRFLPLQLNQVLGHGSFQTR